MMTGTGPYGPVEMGGMFTTLKVRADQKPDDYTDPGWYALPANTQAYEYAGPPLQAAPAAQQPTMADMANHPPARARKPMDHGNHH
jgi:hypothetical protein